jgi:hypothetical protein
MDYWEFLERVINEGIEAATADYTKPTDKSRLTGSIEGFEMCRGKTPPELRDLHGQGLKNTGEAYWKHQDNIEEYRRINSQGAEIEWTCNVVSAALMNQGLPVIVPPTARGVMKAAAILGVAKGFGVEIEVGIVEAWITDQKQDKISVETYTSWTSSSIEIN